MATTFNWIYLGTSTSVLDPTEGNTVAEGANLFLGQTFGSTSDPLYNHITSVTMINNGGNATALDQDNNVTNDQFSTNIGAGTQTFTFDATIVYNTTITYADGTTGTVSMVMAQDTAGHLFLAPEPAAAPAPDTAVYEAKPILSVTINSITNGTTSYAGIGIDRTVTGFDDGYVEGTAGNDLINASYVEPIANGTDRIDNGDGISSAGTAWQDDRVRAGAGNDTVLSGLGNDYVDGGTGADSIDGGSGNDSLFGGAGTFNDTILGGTGNDTIDGGDGNDSLLGGAGTDSILGGLGADAVDGGTEADFIDGGDGNDSLFGGTGVFNDTILGGAGNDTIDGGDGNDSIDGGDGDDSLIGGAGNDTMVGGTGSDTFVGGAGADSISGNQGLDFVDYSGSSAGVNVNLTTNVGSGGDAAGDTYQGLDGIIGSAFDDTLTGFDGFSTNPADPFTNVIYGNAGNDLIDGRDGDDSLYGGADNDTVIGGGGNDLMTGDAGNDLLDGGAGNDTMTGGLGNDRFIGLGIGDVVDGSEDPGNADVDVLDLFGSGWTKATTNIIFSDASHENGTVQFLDGSGNVIGTMSFSNIETIVPCFTPGTLIATDRGEVDVDTLAVGDRVLTRDRGYQEVRWIGRRDLGAAELARLPKLRPVLIAKDALGAGMPSRDLRVSPQHRLLLRAARAELLTGEAEVLAPAVHFLGQPGVARDAAAAGVRYIHLMFDRHEIVRSNGLWSESFQPGAATLSSMDAAVREELFTLFPGLSVPGSLPYPAARLTLKRYEVHQILAS